MIDKRSLARALATKAVAESRPLSWFEELYRKEMVRFRAMNAFPDLEEFSG